MFYYLLNSRLSNGTQLISLTILYTIFTRYIKNISLQRFNINFFSSFNESYIKNKYLYICVSACKVTRNLYLKIKIYLAIDVFNFVIY